MERQDKHLNGREHDQVIALKDEPDVCLKHMKKPPPPMEHRWKKGVSGNPRGRPKKQESLTTLLKEEIARICPADREKRTWKELIVRATLQLAMKGNATALKEIWERLDGKVLQTGKVEFGADGKEIKISVVYENEPGSGSSPDK